MNESKYNKSIFLFISIDFPAIFKTLVEIDYAAPLVIERWAQNERWFEDIVNAKQKLCEIANSVGFDLR